MKNNMLQKITTLLKDNNISEYMFLKQEDMLYSQRLREQCELFCPNFNATWSCPPNVGSIDENIDKCKKYPYALLISAYAELDDETVKNSKEELYVLCRRKLNPIYLEIGKEVEMLTGKDALILRTFCTICKQCTFPDNPCRFPELRSVSVESHGIQMVTMMEKYGFSRFSNDRGYTCIALILFDCDDVSDISFGERVLLKEYPPYVEGQHYVDSLYRAGEISSPLNLCSCECFCPGVYPLNGADSFSPCLLCCDSGITLPLVVREIRESKCPVNLIVMDTHGHSVLHAFSEGIFTADTIIQYLRSLEKDLGSRVLVIPQGIYTQQLPLQRAFPHWKICVAPSKMADLSQYLQNM